MQKESTRAKKHEGTTSPLELEQEAHCEPQSKTLKNIMQFAGAYRSEYVSKDWQIDIILN